MSQHLGYVALLVRDYDEAKKYYTETLGSSVTEDTPLENGKRWLLLVPPGSRATRLLLAKASSPEQIARVGDQTGGRVFLFLHTDDFWRDFHELSSRGVTFCESPRREDYGIVAVFEDLYGNRWDLVQPRAMSSLGRSD
jgi:catechol 2,3-dioxygenase-like lactoylglutathione lyase family enzyme